MRILLVNPTHLSLRRLPQDRLPAPDLRALGAALVDEGHDVSLLDAERDNLGHGEILARVIAHAPDAILIGHSDSRAMHPEICAITRALHQRCPSIRVIYAGVFPSYHWREILAQELQIDIIVRSSGEDTVVQLLRALELCQSVEDVRGIAYRACGIPVATLPAGVVHGSGDGRIGGGQIA